MGTRRKLANSVPSINIWILGKGARGKWKLDLSTADIEEAIFRFTALKDAGKQAASYELGTFEHEGEQVEGQVAFIWTDNLNDYMGSEPAGRGKGWTQDYDTFVDYAYPRALKHAVTTVPASSRQPRQRYVDASCERCGAILPMNELHRYTHEVKTGRVSGTRRTSHSTSYRSSSRSFSTSSRDGSSSTSGRSFYKTVELLLCEECLETQKLEDRSLLQIIMSFLRI